MYLSLLSDDEKKAFLGIAVYAAKANDEVTEVEKDMLRAYCQEMSLPEPDMDHVISYEDATSLISSSDEPHKKMIMLESLGMLEADRTFDAAEHSFANKLADDIGIDRETIPVLDSLLKEYMAVLEKINRAVGLTNR